MGEQANILVIKHGALGDFVQALGPMKAIRAHHPDARITLLTTPPFVSLGRACGCFDHILTDSRPRWTEIKEWSALYKKLNDGRFTRVYDLQNSDRSRFYFRLFRNRPEWVGTARGSSHRNISPDRTKGNAFEGHKHTLALAGIHNIQPDAMDWIKGDLARFGIDTPYVLLVPGSAPSRPEKRWPASQYGILARTLYGWGFRPVIVGTEMEGDLARTILQACPQALDLTGQTILTDLAALGRHAAAAVGNDTGPMHMIAPTGCPSLVLFSGSSQPARHAPIGPHVETLQQDDLSALSADKVIASLNIRGFRQMGESIVFTDRPEH